MNDLLNYNPRYPSVTDLKKRAKKRIPKFAFDYLEGGCNEEINLFKNERDFDGIELRPQYLRPFSGANLTTEIFGRKYDAPFGIAPVGLQGLMWPNAAEILASAAVKHNVPFILSTVTTSSIERIANITDGNFWFQLYHPRENLLRDDLLLRLKQVNCPVLTVLADVPSFGFRYREIKAGLSMPPRMTFPNIVQAMGRPGWCYETLRRGIPEFATLRKYMSGNLDIRQLGVFMDQTFNGRINADKIAAIRDKWNGKLIIKGIASEQDLLKCVGLGADGVIISNHGGRQIDAGESSIRSLQYLSGKFKGRITIMMDGGVRSGPDIARALACGAKFAFMGRPFMYGVSALGDKGGDHTIALFKSQLKQVMEQLCCESPEEIESTLIRNSVPGNAPD